MSKVCLASKAGLPSKARLGSLAARRVVFAQATGSSWALKIQDQLSRHLDAEVHEQEFEVMMAVALFQMQFARRWCLKCCWSLLGPCMGQQATSDG